MATIESDWQEYRCSILRPADLDDNLDIKMAFFAGAVSATSIVGEGFHKYGGVEAKLAEMIRLGKELGEFLKTVGASCNGGEMR